MTDSRRLIPSILFCIVLPALIAHPLTEAADRAEALVTAAEIGIIEEVRALLDIVRILIQRKANINATSRNGSTALMFASGNGHFEVVQDLLKQKAHVNAKDYLGRTALIFASI